jgi:hypothetical protein
MVLWNSKIDSTIKSSGCAISYLLTAWHTPRMEYHSLTNQEIQNMSWYSSAISNLATR